MEYKHTIEIISRNLEELEMLISGFYSRKNIPAIEMDLALSKLRDMYDVLMMIKQAELKHEDTVQPGNYDQQAPTPTVTDTKKEEEKKVIPTEVTEKQEDEKTVTRTEQQPEKEETTTKREKQPEILSDTFKSRTASLNENLGQSKFSKDYGSSWMSKPISDLKNAIGLNDKFLFINELFKGDAEKYNHTMEILNNAANFNEAYNYLMENFDWDMDGELVQNMLNLIRRKLIIHKNE